ncbi:hypothetical protein, partial [Barnesiella intestinihominis]|uniref:hypothetical protein n=1 Tax=Barnesiella intestinihominis TaxID=487174 RepID=UPI003AAF8276
PNTNGFGFVVNENAAFVTGGTGRLILGRNRVICFYSWLTLSLSKDCKSKYFCKKEIIVPFCLL